MKKSIIALTVVLAFFASLTALRAQDTGTTDSPRKFKVAVSAGVLMYAGIGSTTVSTPMYKMSFGLGHFMPGFTGGVEGLFFPSPQHSIAAGAFYDMKRINIRVVNLSLTALVTGPTLTLPFIGTIPSFVILNFLPIEKMVSPVTVNMSYINFPITYRFHFAKYLFVGAGLDIGVLMRASAEYKILILSSSLDMKGFFTTMDFGGRIVGGVEYKGFFLELSGGCSFLDIDKTSGTHRSIAIKAMAGYRI